MLKATLNAQGLTTRKAAHAAIAGALHFPDFYGGNLDALYDMLTTIEAELTLVNAPALMAQLEGYGMRLLRTMEEAAQENPSFILRME